MYSAPAGFCWCPPRREGVEGAVARVEVNAVERCRGRVEAQRGSGKVNGSLVLDLSCWVGITL
eukprot:4859736-Prymnesium_polylepis.1